MASQTIRHACFTNAVQIIAAIGTLLIAPDLNAEVYKWRDEQGRIHYSDRPVSESSTEVKIRQAPPGAPRASTTHQRQEKMRRMLDAYDEARSDKKEAKLKAKKEREKRKMKCVYAKDRYQQHRGATGIYNFDEAGNRRYLNEADRKRHMQKLKAEVAHWCK
jgi:hypothetical protein